MTTKSIPRPRFEFPPGSLRARHPIAPGARQPAEPVPTVPQRPAAPQLDRLSGAPPLQLGPASSNFLRRPSGMAARAVNDMLTPADLTRLAGVSLHMRYETRNSVQFREAERFMKARRAFASAQSAFGAATNHRNSEIYAVARRSYLASKAHYRQTQLDIIEARAARGLRQPLLPALREARRLLADPKAITSAMLLDAEQMLVEAADQVGSVQDFAHTLHRKIWDFRNLRLGEAPNDESISTTALCTSLELLADDLANAMTADLRHPGDALALRLPQRQVVYVKHFADEPWIPGKMVVQSDTDAMGKTTTKTLPWPDPAQGVTRLRIQFRPQASDGRTYIHTFNVPPTELEAMD